MSFEKRKYIYERLNLTIRQGSSYLFRRSSFHAKDERYLDNHLAIFQCYYNFIRPHKSLKFGKVTITPAMQAGITKRKLSFREIFSAKLEVFCFTFILKIEIFVGNLNKK